jgi:hypothetical protein
MDEFEANDGFTIRPASREVGRPVDPIVERAREMKTFVDQGLDRRPVFVHVGEITRAGDFFRIVEHFRLHSFIGAQQAISGATDRASFASKFQKTKQGKRKTPEYGVFQMVGTIGFEPMTSTVSM